MKVQTLMMMMLAGSIFAQQITDSRTATRRSGGGDGKCTIEVDVDGAAEVEVYGNRAQIRTLSGSPATFKRFECNQDMPSSPIDFRFQGIDGRGRQELVRNPSRGPAVIRIEDSAGGREGYTFDLMWRGGSGVWNDSGFGNNSGVFGNDRYPDSNRYPNTYPDNNRNPNNRYPNDGYGNSGVFGGNNNANGNREINFRGRGDGYFRDDRGSNARLSNCRVSVNRRGIVEVTFQTDSSFGITMRGRVQRMDGNRIYADMSGNNMTGVMEIDTDGNRVRNVQMRTGGNSRAELSWSSRN